jgi:hypothetical protein
MAGAIDLRAWLREQCASYRFELAGILQRVGRPIWPVSAITPSDLEQKLTDGGYLLPLPKEPAALANVLEVAIVDYLLTAAARSAGLHAVRGTERGYPDMEFSGEMLEGYEAVDVKVARRDNTKKRLRTNSRITLYTGNTYFKYPNLKWPGNFRAFQEYTRHLDIIVIYSLNEANAARLEDPEIIVQEAWRIASRQRSSTTREYLGAVNLITDLRDGKGDFETPEAFYAYWRKYPFRLSSQVQKELDKALREATNSSSKKITEAR